MNNEKRSIWWGEYHLPSSQVLSWRIGPYTLRVQRASLEWRVSGEEGSDSLDNSLSLAQVDTCEDLRDTEDLRRIGTKNSGSRVFIQPRLADRPVVTRPDHPFIIPACEDATLYVSTPLWVVVKTEKGLELFEAPLWRPSDTWFGPNTWQGELCYASKTSCRLNIEDIPKRPHRAITTLKIINKADTPLSLDRINLPVIHLSLFASMNGDLWTQDLTLTRMPDESLSPAALGKGSPHSVGTTELVTPPRIVAPNNLVVRAFSTIFS